MLPMNKLFKGVALRTNYELWKTTMGVVYLIDIRGDEF